MKEETKPSSFTVNTIVYVEKLEESIVNIVEVSIWFNNVPGYKIKDNFKYIYICVYIYNIYIIYKTIQ